MLLSQGPGAGKELASQGPLLPLADDAVAVAAAADAVHLHLHSGRE